MAASEVAANGTVKITLAVGESLVVGAGFTSANVDLRADNYSPEDVWIPETAQTTDGRMANETFTFGAYSVVTIIRLEETGGVGHLQYDAGTSPALPTIPSGDLEGTATPYNISGLDAAQGGIMSINGGDSSTATNAGGAANVIGGDGATTGAGGAASVTGGTPGVTGTGGAANLTSGLGGATSGPSGVATVSTGVTTAGSGSATGALNVNSGAGATSAAAVAGGATGAVTVSTGAGGANTGGATGQAGGAAGAVAVTGGVGGATDSTAAHNGGAGGDVSKTGGAGGAVTGAGSTGVGGAGGDITETGGVGGAAVGGNGGAGGAAVRTLGTGGASSTAVGGVGGSDTLQAGAGGAALAGSGDGGKGGDIIRTAGLGGASSGGDAGVIGRIIDRSPKLFWRGASSTHTVSATMTAADILAGNMTVNEGTTNPSALQLPLATALDTAVPQAAANDAFQFSLTNISTDAGEDATITTNTGWTLSGSMAVASNAAATDKSAGIFVARKTGAGAWTLTRDG